MLRAVALFLLVELLAGCSGTRGPGVPGGTGGVGNPLPIPDGGISLSDADIPLLVCQAIPAEGLINTISVENSFELLSFNLTYVFAKWNCAADEPEIWLGMSDSGCSFGSGQRLVMRIPALPTNADGASIADSAEYVRPSNYDPQGRCGFDEGSFTFDVALLNPDRFKADFTLLSMFLLCDEDFEASALTITGAFDIDLGHSYETACES